MQLTLRLKSKQYDRTYSKNKRIKILNYNQRINLINLKLARMQDTFYRRKVLGSSHDEALRDFNQMFYSLVRITQNEEFKISRKKDYKVCISLTKHLSFKQLNDNLDLFVKIADRKIDDWHRIDPPSFPSYAAGEKLTKAYCLIPSSGNLGDIPPWRFAAVLLGGSHNYICPRCHATRPTRNSLLESPLTELFGSGK